MGAGFPQKMRPHYLLEYLAHDPCHISAQKEDAWLVKHELHLFEKEGIKERAAYVFENTVTVLLARQAIQKMMKWVRPSVEYVLPLRKEKTTVYSKADRTSAVAGTTIEGVKEKVVEYATPGLKGDGQYWYVFQFEGTPFFSGFIPEEDLIIDQ